MVDLQGKIAAGKSAASALADALAALADRPGASSEAIEEAKAAEATAHGAVEAARQRSAELAARLGALNKLEDDAECPTCGTRLTDHDPEALAAEIAAVRDALDTAEDEKERLGDTHTHAIEVTQRLLRRRDARVSAEETVATLRAKQVDVAALQALEIDASSRLDALNRELAAVGVALDSAETTNERHASAVSREAKAKKAVGAAAESVTTAQAALVPNAPTDDEIAAAQAAETAHRDAVATHRVEQQRLAHAVEMARSAATTTKERNQNAQATLDRLLARAEEARSSLELASKASRLARFLAERRASYLKEVWDTVLAAASRQVKVASAGLIQRIEYSDGEFSFDEDGVVAPVTSASGAQKAFIGTAVRIGLARALYGSDGLLILDEPTEAMGERNAMGLSASLVGAAKQTLLITHREQDQSLAANIIQL
ncbi:hypothetical protein D9M70_342020 [compost metagenome]